MIIILACRILFQELGVLWRVMLPLTQGVYRCRLVTRVDVSDAAEVEVLEVGK
jgi:hypothetical protein